MTRAGEAALLAGASALAAMGVALVNLADGRGVDAQVALTFLVFALAFGGVHLAVRKWAPHANPFLFVLAGILTAIGFSVIYRLDGELASLQRWWLLIAAGSAVLTLWVLDAGGGLVVVRRYRYSLLFTALALLLLPLFPEGWPLAGVEVNGSRLWFRVGLGGFRVQFQPGELAKLLLVGFLASYLSERQPALAQMTRRAGPFHLPEPRQLLPVLIAWLVSFAVLVYQRDLGASLLLFALFISLLYMGTGRLAYLAAGGTLFLGGALVANAAFSHVQRRVLAWLQPFSDFEGAGYQIAQSLFALGSGSLTGSGLGLGRPDLIPNAATDFVFAAVAEEMGLGGSIAVVAAYALLVAAAFGVALRARDLFRKLLAGGLAFVLGLQTLLIIGGVIRLLPLTGITLPFMSYGGSSLVSNFVLLAALGRLSHEERS